MGLTSSEKRKQQLKDLAEKLKQYDIEYIPTKIFNNKQLFKCNKCNTRFLAKPKYIRKKPICRNCMCGASYGEEIAIQTLKDHNIEFEKEKTFKGLVGVGGGKLRFDFYIRSNNIVIEIDGQQHNKPNNMYGANTEEHDILKNKYCKDNNIKLYRISYRSDTKCKVREKLETILVKEKLI